MTDRAPSFDTFDAVVRLCSDGAGGDVAYALVKHTYSFRGRRLERIAPVPLENEPMPDAQELPPHTDFYPMKPATDIVVIGNAYAPYGVAAERFDARLTVGDVSKEVAVFGPRTLRMVDGRPRISAPEPVREVLLDRTEAYGGKDLATPVFAEPGSEAEAALLFDHPGIYPRNEGGRGYLVVPEPGRELAMPSLEDPTDLLDEHRIQVKKAYRWYQQPLPCFLGRTALSDFPRIAHIGLYAWYLGPEDDALPEVARGWLPMNYRSTWGEGETEPRTTWFRQEAPPDMIFPRIPPNAPFTFYNMHEEKPIIGFDFLDRLPEIEFRVAGRPVSAETTVHTVVCYPNEACVTVVFGAAIRLERRFIPGIHRHIPISARIDRDTEVLFETPSTNRELLAAIVDEHAASKGMEQ